MASLTELAFPERYKPSRKVTVYAAMSARGIINTYFLSVIWRCRTPELQNLGWRNQRTLFRQDRVTRTLISHTLAATRPRFEPHGVFSCEDSSNPDYLVPLKEDFSNYFIVLGTIPTLRPSKRFPICPQIKFLGPARRNCMQSISRLADTKSSLTASTPVFCRAERFSPHFTKPPSVELITDSSGCISDFDVAPAEAPVAVCRKIQLSSPW